MKKKVRYIEEIYTDKYKTLYQAILIDTWLVAKSNGRHSKELRASVNPNLTTLLEIRYLDENFKIIKRERIVGEEIERFKNIYK